MVDEPRLSRWYRSTDQLPDEALAWFRVAVGRHYRVGFGAIGLNYYRDGRDSVAPHADRELRDLDDTLVAILTLGAARPFLLRRQGGGRGHRPPPRLGRPAGHGGHVPGHLGARRARRWRPEPDPGSAHPSAGPEGRGAEQEWAPPDRQIASASRRPGAGASRIARRASSGRAGAAGQAGRMPSPPASHRPAGPTGGRPASPATCWGWRAWRPGPWLG